MECRTGKHVYRSERAAGDALRTIREQRLFAVVSEEDKRRQECRAYECGKCFGWHLTSLPEPPTHS